MPVINNNTSYTNKDFNSIYSELLDIIPNLTNKWNPSNEADPGVVLVKLMAVLGDKLNYNIDKQVLECFPGSVTQRKNARQIFNLIGYRMPWYKAAVAEVGFKLKANLVSSDNTSFNTVKIPRFTQLTDANTSVSFFTNSDVVLYGEDISTIKYTHAFQGNLVEYSINNSTYIKLSNLDENYKLYLSDINVAENAIFISDAGTNIYDWKQVDNVDAYPLGEKVYEFGVSDDETQCYLKFPTDVNELCMSDSLEIKYITCDGVNGNILANVLTNFAVTLLDSEDNAVEDQVVIVQSTSTQNGEDPESIEKAYENSRKVVGTFDTLVTKKDFENYIKLLTDTDGVPVVSNVVVADRKDDFNQVINVKSFESFETKDRIKTLNIAAYDLIAYMLNYQPVHLDDSESTIDRAYNNSFIPVSDETTMLVVENMLDEVKAVNVNINLTDSNTNALFKGVYSIEAEIITSEKLTKDEAAELELNVKKNLEYKYQSYNTPFGKMINYMDLIDTITSIDARIKAVSLTKIDYAMKKVVMQTSGTAEQSLTNADKLNILAKSIARGNVQPFIFSDTFKPDFGQTDGKIVDLKKITPAYSVTLQNGDTNGVTLRGGEVINLFAPKITNTKTYTSGCRITWVAPTFTAEELERLGITEGSDSSSQPFYILSPDTYYEVGTGSDGIGAVTVSYLDSNNIKVQEQVPAGALIKCDQAIVSNKKEQIISTGNQFGIYEDDIVSIPSGSKYLLYLENNSNSTITLNANAEILLNINDVFLYYDALSATWVQLGSGYTLRNSTPTTLTLSLTTQEGLMKPTDAKTTLPAILTVVDNDIVTLNEGCIIRYIDPTETHSTLAVSSIPTSIYEGSKVEVVDASGTSEISKNARNVYYKLFSRLDLVYGNDPIILYKGDSIAYTDIDDEDDSIQGTNDPAEDGVNKVAFSKPITIIGSGDVAVSDLSLFSYNDDNSTTSQFQRGADGLVTITSNTANIPLRAEGTYNRMLLPIHVEGSANIACNIGSSATVSSMDGTTTTFATGDYILSLSNLIRTLSISSLSTGGKVQLGKPIVVSAINESELSGTDYVVNASNFQSVVTAVNNLVSPYKFDYTYEVSDDNKCASPTNIESFFDANHIYNKLTIAQMDNTKEGYKIKVNKFSIRS